MFASDPVSRLSTQITRWSRASSASHRCDPRNPAPPVTTVVGIGEMLPASAAVSVHLLQNSYLTGIADPAPHGVAMTATAPAASSTKTNGSVT